MKNPHYCFEKLRSKCRLMSTSQTLLPVLLTGFTGGEDLRDTLLGNWHYLRDNLLYFQDKNVCKNWEKNSESSHVLLEPHDIKSFTESGGIGSSVVDEEYWTTPATEILNFKDFVIS